MENLLKISSAEDLNTTLVPVVVHVSIQALVLKSYCRQDEREEWHLVKEKKLEEALFQFL